MSYQYSYRENPMEKHLIMTDEYDHIPVRLTKLETNVDRLTADVKELTRAVGDNIKSQSELMSTLSSKVIEARNPDWHVWAGFLAVAITMISVIYTIVENRYSAIQIELTHRKEEFLLRDEIVSLKLQNVQTMSQLNQEILLSEEF